MEKATGAGGVFFLVLISLGVIAFAILNLVGLGYLTAVIFGNTSYASLTTTQRNLVRMSVIVSWIGVGFSVLKALFSSQSKSE